MLNNKEVVQKLTSGEANIKYTIATSSGAVIVCKIFHAELEINLDVVFKIYDLTEKFNERYPRFITEVKAYLHLVYSIGVMPVTDFGFFDDFAFISMGGNPGDKIYEHKTLRDIVNSENTSISDVAMYAYYSSLSITAMRGKWQFFSHGDIKPENFVLINDFPFLIDFETASFENDGCLPRTTLPYRAPELFDENSVATGSTDIYSFGVLLYEMLEKINIMSGDNNEHSFSEWRNIHKNQNPIERIYDCPYKSAFIALIKKCVKRDADNRLTFNEFFIELNSILTEFDAEKVDRYKNVLLFLVSHIGTMKEKQTSFVSPIKVFSRLAYMKEYEFAVKYFNQINFEDKYFALMAKAVYLDEESRYEESIEIYYEILNDNSLSSADRSDILCNLALAYKHNKNFDDSKKIFEHLLSKADLSIYDGIYSNYMSVFIEAGEYNDAARLGKHRTMKNPNSGMVWANLAIAYIHLGRKEDAYSAILQVKKREPYSYAYFVAVDKYNEIFGGENNA